jgi:tetratricopeptide (TPR) repeat protein
VNWHGLALAFLDEGHPTAALGAARRAVSESPARLDAQLTLGSLCERAGYARDAVTAFEAARKLEPHNAGIVCRLSAAYRRAGRATDALAAAHAAAELDPDAAATCVCLGDALVAAGAPVAADRLYRRALAIDPRSARAECGRAEAALAETRWHDARAAFERALALDADCAEARYGRALLDLRFENYRAGFAGFGAIVETEEQRPRYHYHQAGVPIWDGTPLALRRLVVAYEMGLGNQIMMARFFAALPRFGADVAIETPPALLALFRRNFPELTFTSFTNWQPIENMDVHLPLMQLPGVLGVEDEAGIATPGPYLAADPARVAALRARLDLEPGLRHVGVVWHGNRANARDRWRSAPLPAWAPLAAVPGLRFHSLQLGATPAELADAPFALAPTHALITDMEDTAALAELMDHIVTVDTSVVHLAGAIGRPVWMPQPQRGDYRWGVDRSDSPWYPSLHIARQLDWGDWQPAFREIATQLAT